ncbi:DUF2179 domain-containing protein [Candidatus Woesearchaeota archaeon]|nr:DUF2179 domain-containing protein [Candidatus Woesearchaeota archaeon]
MLEGIAVSDVYTWVIIPVLIFLARIIDVSLGTMRVIFIARGFKFLAPFLGFFEVSVWLLAIQQIFAHVTNVACFIAYGAGFAAGTFAGIVIEERLSVGKVIVRIVTRRDASKLVRTLDKEGFVETVSNAATAKGKVKIVYVVIDRHDIAKVVELVKGFHPNAFYSIEDTRFVSAKLPPRTYQRSYTNLFGFYRKGK